MPLWGGLAAATGGAVSGAFASSTSFGAMVAGGAASGAVNGGLSAIVAGGNVGAGIWQGALGGAIGGMMPSINVQGIVPGALVGAGLGGLGGGLAGGTLSSINGGNFGDGFRQGAINGAIGGALSGGISGGIAAKNSFYDRNVIFGNLSQSGRAQAFLDFSNRYGVNANIVFEKLSDNYGETRPLDPHTGKPITPLEVARKYPNGVNSEVAYCTNRLMSLKKIEANVIHEGRHVMDLRAGRATEFYKASATSNGFRGRFEISAHTAVYNSGLQKSYNLSRINYWSQFP